MCGGGWGGGMERGGEFSLGTYKPSPVIIALEGSDAGRRGVEELESEGGGWEEE